MRNFLVGSLTLLVAGLLPISAMAKAPISNEFPHDLIDSLDGQFRNMYADGRKEFIKDGGPILIVSRGDVILYVGDKVTAQEHYSPEAIQVLKTVDHIALGLFTELVHNPENASAEQLKTLAAFREAIVKARPQVEGAGLSAETLSRQQTIIDRSLKLLDDVVKNNGCTPDELKAFVKEIAPLSNANVKEATGLELAALNEVVGKLRHELSPEGWNKLRVVVCGSHMARIEETHMQYFERLLSEPYEGHRVIFYDGNAEQKDALELVGNHEIDAQIGLSYFGDSARMHRDLLSVYASQYLDEHPVQ